MSCIVCGKWGCQDHVGYKGQRYEVRFKDGDGRTRVYGWADEVDATKPMVDSVNLHPVWNSPEVVDLGKDPKNRRPGKRRNIW